jgi:hypothetical protein
MFGFGKKHSDLDKQLASKQEAVLAALNALPCPPVADHLVDDRVVDAIRVDESEDGNKRVVVEVVLVLVVLLVVQSALMLVDLLAWRGSS